MNLILFRINRKSTYKYRHNKSIIFTCLITFSLQPNVVLSNILRQIIFVPDSGFREPLRRNDSSPGRAVSPSPSKYCTDRSVAVRHTTILHCSCTVYSRTLNENKNRKISISPWPRQMEFLLM